MIGNSIQLVNELRAEFMESDTVKVYEEWDKDIILDFLEYSVSSNSIFPVLNIDSTKPNYNFDGQLFQTVNPNGSRWKAIPSRIANDGHCNFEVVSYDSDSKEYKFQLRTPMILPGGSKLAFKHDGTPKPEDNVTFKAIYRVL
ncbi:hypothetical protein [Virgibacillus sp. Bac330]|uniref:hypothetical protein n=1 Tax=Virgibacillus sp. Bac330 TaxID=2419841 RepID=UPI000EF4E037|nr:hypothetical protein [Virgibacillus sp. Bac330]